MRVRRGRLRPWRPTCPSTSSSRARRRPPVARRPRHARAHRAPARASVEREVLDEGELDLARGLVGDTWNGRPSKKTPDGSPHPEMQLNVMNAARRPARGRRRPGPAGAGRRPALPRPRPQRGQPPARDAAGHRRRAVIEITAEPHRGCAKFSERFGVDAVRFVNSRRPGAEAPGHQRQGRRRRHDPPGRHRHEALTPARRSGHAHHHRLQPRGHAHHRHGPHGHVLRAGLRRRRHLRDGEDATTTRG